MAICKVCNSLEAKRKCLAHEDICPQCCGTFQKADKCTGCQYFTGSNSSTYLFKDLPRY